MSASSVPVKHLWDRSNLEDAPLCERLRPRPGVPVGSSPTRPVRFESADGDALSPRQSRRGRESADRDCSVSGERWLTALSTRTDATSAPVKAIAQLLACCRLSMVFT